MAKRVVVGLCAAWFALSHVGQVTAQDTLLAELYGQAVHAYFAGNYGQAEQLLSEAAAAGSRDPRVFYFRGLTLKGLGRAAEGDADLRQAAQLEVAGTDRIYPVSQSLTRIQGRQRLELEKIRQEARLKVRRQTVDRNRNRYEELQRSEADVLRQPSGRAATPAPQQPAAPGAAPADATDPFSTPAPSASPSPATPAPAMPADDPFATPAAPAAPAAPASPATDSSDPFRDDPFGAPGAAPAAPAAPAPADADPFGGGAAPTEPSADPFGM